MGHIIVEDVQSAVSFDRGIHHRLDGSRIEGIEVDRRRAAADLICHLFRCIDRYVGDQHGRALRRQPPRRRAAQTTGAAGDDGHFSFDSPHIALSGNI